MNSTLGSVVPLAMFFIGLLVVISQARFILDDLNRQLLSLSGYATNPLYKILKEFQLCQLVCNYAFKQISSGATSDSTRIPLMEDDTGQRSDYVRHFALTYTSPVHSCTIFLCCNYE